MEDEKVDQNYKIISQKAIVKPLTETEKLALLEKVSKNLKGKMVKMTDKEIEDFYDTRRF